ncbi:hypothetical protein IGI04_010404 [Brassica rapa subsp. trilocularis]|uniref:Uncharacterized protein n=1 Tax=Brassica rapa subsp. trilocularis TaxID=1813537 RepID=A0ABQ7N060_BRACM|nr:hypothetical protein IGI04_010404 [Brassica rapa subsp. trilocularis]
MSSCGSGLASYLGLGVLPLFVGVNSGTEGDKCISVLMLLCWSIAANLIMIASPWGDGAYEARGEPSQGPMDRLSWDRRVFTTTVKDSNLFKFCLCVGDVRVLPAYLYALLKLC